METMRILALVMSSVALAINGYLIYALLKERAKDNPANNFKQLKKKLLWRTLLRMRLGDYFAVKSAANEGELKSVIQTHFICCNSILTEDIIILYQDMQMQIKMNKKSEN
jgi:hypothetical protein